MTDNFGSGNAPDDFPAVPQGGQTPQQPGQMPPPQQPGQMPPVQQPGQMPPMQQQPGQPAPMPQAQAPAFQGQAQQYPQPQDGYMMPREENKKIMAGICALLVGSLGVHKFVLGYTNEGIIQIVATFLTCGLAGIIPIIEGIIYLTKSDEEFYQMYQVGRKTWF